jgi:hypothetical protein
MAAAKLDTEALLDIKKLGIGYQKKKVMSCGKSAPKLGRNMVARGFLQASHLRGFPFSVP